MKVVCIKKYLSTELRYELTYGKTYDVVTPKGDYGIDSNNHLILNDRNFKEWYSKDTFITLEEWREHQLNKLGIH